MRRPVIVCSAPPCVPGQRRPGHGWTPGGSAHSGLSEPETVKPKDQNCRVPLRPRRPGSEAPGVQRDCFSRPRANSTQAPLTVRPW